MKAGGNAAPRFMRFFLRRYFHRTSLLIGLFVSSFCAAPLAARDTVELELVLAIDTSASVDMSEFRLQMRGLALAFQDPAVIAAIEGTGPAGIAVTVVQWSSAGEQRQVVPWTRIFDSGSAERFAAAIAARPQRHFNGSTGIGGALQFSERLIRTNRFSGRRKSIDVSADGINNSGPPPHIPRDEAVAQGITINGLTILDETPHLDRYFEENVIGGAGSFVMTVASYADIIAATRAKLLREISVSVAGGSATNVNKNGGRQP